MQIIYSENKNCHPYTCWKAGMEKQWKSGDETKQKKILQNQPKRIHGDFRQKEQQSTLNREFLQKDIACGSCGFIFYNK